MVLNARDAARRGARVLVRTALVSAKRGADTWTCTLRSAEGVEQEVRARVLVNAAGPWVEQAARHRGAARRRTRPAGARQPHRPAGAVRGRARLHPAERRRPRGLRHPLRRRIQPRRHHRRAARGRPGGRPAARTRRLPISAPPSAASSAARRGRRRSCGASPACARSATTAPATPPRCPAIIRCRWTGEAARAPALSVFGGKITTYRRLAEEAMDRLGGVLGGGGARTPWTGTAPLPGGDLGGLGLPAFERAMAERHPWLPPPVLRRLARSYGSELEALLGGATSLADLGAGFRRAASPNGSWSGSGRKNGRERPTTCFGAAPASACT